MDKSSWVIGEVLARQARARGARTFLTFQNHPDVSYADEAGNEAGVDHQLAMKRDVGVDAFDQGLAERRAHARQQLADAEGFEHPAEVTQLVGVAGDQHVVHWDAAVVEGQLRLVLVGLDQSSLVVTVRRAAAAYRQPALWKALVVAACLVETNAAESADPWRVIGEVLSD